jgi:hypothetical protein
MSLEDLAWLWMAGFFAMLGGTMTIAVLKLDNDDVYDFMRRPLYPGLYAAYVLLSGGHSSLIYFIPFLVNAVVYGGAVILMRLIWRYITDKHSLQPHRPSKDTQP